MLRSRIRVHVDLPTPEDEAGAFDLKVNAQAPSLG